MNTDEKRIPQVNKELLEIAIDWRRVNRFLLFCGSTLLVLAFMALVYWPLLLPLVLSAFLTYLLLPLVDRIERWGVNRSMAILALVLSSLAAIGFGLTRLLPMLYQQLQIVLRLIPSAMDTVLQSWLPLAEKYVNDLGVVPPEQVHRLFNGFNLFGELQTQVRSGLTGLWDTGATLAGGVLSVVLVPFITFFLLKDYRRLERSLSRLVPRDLETPLRFVTARVNVTLRAVIKGQAIVAAILAVLYAIGLSVVGLQSAIAIGVVAGICRVIPYLDVIVGASLSTIVILSEFQGWGQVLGVAVVFLVVQAIDGAFITPQVIGERVGLHPMVVVLSVLAFAYWFGFWGVLMAIPVVAIATVLLGAAKPFYLGSLLYKGQGLGAAPSIVPGPDDAQEQVGQL